MSKSLVVELARHQIRVNAICRVMSAPGLLEQFMGLPDTPENCQKFLATIPLGRSTPRDISRAAVYLASDGPRLSPASSSPSMPDAPFEPADDDLAHWRAWIGRSEQRSGVTRRRRAGCGRDKLVAFSCKRAGAALCGSPMAQATAPRLTT